MSAAPKAITLPPSRPVSNSSSTESTLTRELSRHDLSGEAGGATVAGGGLNGHPAHHHQPHQQQQHSGSQRGVDPISFSKVGPCQRWWSHD